MKKLIIILLLFTNLYAETISGVKWGLPLDVVRLLETKELISQSEDDLVYKDNLIGYKCDLLYFFDDQQRLYAFRFNIDTKIDFLSVFIYKKILRECKRIYGVNCREIYIPIFFNYKTLRYWICEENAIYCKWELKNDVQAELRLYDINGKLEILLEYIKL